MASGWLTSDIQTQERRNREWVARYILGLPFPDVDDALAPQVLPRAVSFAITGTETNFATFAPASIVVVHKITLTNTTDGALAPWVALHGGAFTYNDLVARVSALQPREPILFDGPWFCAGGSIVRAAMGGGTSGVAGRIDYSLLQQTTPGLTFVFGRVGLTATPTALYTAPGDVRSAFVASIGIVGLGVTDYSSAVILELLPSGQASAPAFYLLSGPQLAQDTDLVGGFTLQPGDAIRAWRSSGSEGFTLAFNVVEFRG